MGAAVTVYVWLIASVAALVAAWWMAAPGSTRARVLWLIAALAWYPVQYSLSLAQPDLIVLLAAVACWKLADRNRPYLAGVVLGASVLKPQLTLVLPLVLLVAGRWRIAAAWAVTVGFLAIVSVLVIGQQGLSDYRTLLSDAMHVANNRYFTFAYIFGTGPVTFAVQAVVVAIGVASAYANRHSSLARLFAIGLVSSALGAGYWHLQDFAMLVGAAWLFWRDPAPAWQRWWLVVVVVGGELGWPLTPLPILIGLTVWLIYLAFPQPHALRTAQAQ